MTMTILSLVVVLGVLIFIHELGHFWAAKLVDIKVERFSIGLGPKVFGFQWGETEYVLSAIPLGGYVKMGGMEDEMMEAIEGGKGESRQRGPRDFDAKPIWARTFVISAGVIMNLIFAFVVYTVTGFSSEVVATNRVGAVEERLLTPGSEALATIRPGALVLAVGDVEVERWADVGSAIFDAPAGEIVIRLDEPARELTVDLPRDLEERARLSASLTYWVDATVGTLQQGPAADAGIQLGDRFLSVAGVPVRNWWDFREMIRGRAGQETPVTVLRDGEELALSLTPAEQAEPDPITGDEVRVGAIGVGNAGPEVVSIENGPLAAIGVGFNQTVEDTRIILRFLKELFTGGVSPRSVGSIITIGSLSGQMAQLGLEPFFIFMAFFSVNLAVLNLLPIPILDGGHLVFLAVEAVRGRAVSIEARLRWSQVGFVVVMLLMVWALGNDVLRLFGV